MRAVLQSGYGPASTVLSVAEIERPPPAPGEVLVRVRAAGVAKGNWLITHGLPYIARPAYGIRSPKQPVAGLQFAGTVSATGEGAGGFAEGDPVFGAHSGTFAEFVAIRPEELVRVPDGTSLEQAATAPIAGLAALQAVRDGGQVSAGQRVLVLGASGGVGSYAVQIAKAFGAEVTGVASAKNLDLLRSLGADHVVDYRSADPLAGARFDAILDLAGNRPVSRLLGALGERGTLVIVGGTGGRWTMGFERTVGAMLRAPFVRHRIVGLISTPSHADLRALADLMAEGKLSPVIQSTVPLDDAAAAVEAAGAGRGAGTIVLTM